MDNMEKINIAAELLESTGIYDQHSLESKLSLITLENQTLFEYYKVLQCEIEKLKTKKREGKSVVQGSVKDDTEIIELEKAYRIIYKFYSKIPKRSAAMKKFESTQKDLLLSFADRKQDHERLNKQHESVMSDPKLKEKIAELDALKLDIATEEHRLAALTKENEDISAKLAEKERNKQNLLDEEKQNVAEVERQITEVELYLANNDEEVLSAEIFALERQLGEIQENLDDDCSSGCSNSVDNSPAAAPVFEKLTTDLSNLFKNPNNFSVMSPKVKTVKNQKQRSSGKQVRSNSPVTSAIGSKKVRYGLRKDLPVSSPIRPKSPVLVTSKCHQNLANLIVEKSTPLAPSPIIISPPSDEKPQAAKILRVEILPQLSAVAPLTDKAVKPSNADQNANPYVPRSLDKEYETPKQQSDKIVVTVENSSKDSSPCKNQEELIQISESPEKKPDNQDEQTEERNSEENQMEITDNNKRFDDGLTRQNSSHSCFSNSFTEEQMEGSEMMEFDDIFNFSFNDDTGNKSGFTDFDADDNDGCFDVKSTWNDKSNDGGLF